jgi:hypothetical protein
MLSDLSNPQLSEQFPLEYQNAVVANHLHDFQICFPDENWAPIEERLTQCGKSVTDEARCTLNVLSRALGALE